MSIRTVPQIAIGELVDVQIRGARVENLDCPGNDTFATLTIGSYPVSIALHAPGVTVTRAAPAQWPPQVGDIWADRDGSEWVAGATDGETIVMWRLGVRGTDDALDVLANHGPMTLLRRRGWTPATDTTPAEAEPAHQPIDRRAALVASLRAGADWIERHTELPVTDWRDRAPTYCCGSEGELERIAAQLGVPVKVEDHSGHLRITVPVDGVTYEAFRVPEQRKPAQWLEIFHPGVTILDYDGWRDERFDSVMTRHEFERRLAMCTITTQPAATQPDEPVEDDPAEADPEAPVPAPAAAPSIDDDAFDATVGTVPPAGRLFEDTLKSPVEWLTEYPGTQILDWDGWHDKDITEPISHAEFHRRLTQCTITGPAKLPHRTPDPDAASLLARSLADGAA